jgi:EAL domain-containing protein (putative c-di-GMP-specific phosphodiesterase class I)/GGDEF domain-containing protein
MDVMSTGLMLQSDKESSNATADRLRAMLAACENEKAALRTRNMELAAKIHEREKYEHKLLQRMYLDEKTGFPNHAYLYKDCRHLFSGRAAVSSDPKSAIIFIALDETFEMLKKSHVSVVSEWLLYKIAHWIKEIIGARGKVYHSRDTEFAAILHHVENEADCSNIAEKIYAKISEIHSFPGHHITIGCHIGCAIYPDHGENTGAMLRSADIALTECRKNNRTFAVFSSKMAQELKERLDLKHGILRALEVQTVEEIESQFDLCFQPLVHVASLKNNKTHHKVIGSECLLRWNHPMMGPISPGRFIPLAEESGLIIPIGNWVLYNATQKLVEFQKHAKMPLYMSVNLSPKQFYDPYLVENIERILNTRDLDPGSIHLEITETSMMEDPEDTRLKCDLIQKMGMKISIDDFGTGYSSLSYLKDIRVDTIKIDKSFVDDVATNNQNQGIVKAIISMARSLGMDILAEGVEEFDQLDFIHNQGCSEIQGYYFSKPLSFGDFASYLSAG